MEEEKPHPLLGNIEAIPEILDESAYTNGSPSRWPMSSGKKSCTTSKTGHLSEDHSKILTFRQSDLNIEVDSNLPTQFQAQELLQMYCCNRASFILSSDGDVHMAGDLF